MGKTWNKREGHNKNVKNYKNEDWGYKENNKSHATKSNHRSERKAKELKKKFENEFWHGTLEFLDF